MKFSLTLFSLLPLMYIGHPWQFDWLSLRTDNVWVSRGSEGERSNLGVELTRELARVDSSNSEAVFKTFWNHGDAILCCAYKSLPEFTFANRAGLEMLETSSGALQELTWEKTVDENGRKTAYSDFSQVMTQGYACLPAGVRISSMGRPAAYEQAIAWKVVDEEDHTQCIAFMFMNWSFL